MSTSKIALWSGVVVLSILGGCAWFGLSPFLHGNTTVNNIGSAVGTTFGTAKFAGINMSPATGSATSSSILNTDASDRYISSLKIGCQSVGTSKAAYTGAGIASNGWTLSVATSSTASPATNSNTNIVGGGAIAISTSTPQFVEASSTASTAAPNTGSSFIGNIWPAGSYLTFTFNATNTAACTVGADYFQS